MTRQWIAASLPGTALPARLRESATIGVLAVAVCALVSVGAAASATGHVYEALGKTSVAAPAPQTVGGGGVGNDAAGGGGVGNDDAAGGGGVGDFAVGGGGVGDFTVGGGGVGDDAVGGGGVSDFAAGGGGVGNY